MSDKIFLTWDDIFQQIDKFIPEFKKLDFTDIVGIARGGLIPAQLLAHKLHITRVHSLGISRYYDRPAEGLIRESPLVYQGLEHNQYYDRVLLVDEITDKGESFKIALSELSHHVDPDLGCIITFSMYYKPCSVYQPDYIGEEVDSDKWIVFPYEEANAEES